ncbi:MAG: RNA polymerase sigma-70 factor (ECF subfamily) [Ilumatobacter sp.]|jgi:RNA polymerase sigma-70 factor (ECF subfamily)
MAPLSDDELVAAAQGGDRSAMDQLLRRHYDRIYAVCRRVTGGAKDADDACQEALIKIARNLPRFDGRAAFSTWAYRIATNASLDELRKRKRRPRLHSMNPHGDGSDSAGPEVVDPMAAKRIDAIDDRLAIDEALGELSDDFKAAVVLRDVADLDYDEIADVLQIPIGTVKSRIARGRAALAESLRLADLLDAPGTLLASERDGVMNVTDPVTEEIRIIGNHAADQERPTDSS